MIAMPSDEVMPWLADTHVILWYLAGDDRLGPTTIATLNSRIAMRKLSMSVASLYELVIAARKPRWPLEDSALDVIARLEKVGLSWVPLTSTMARLASALPLPHGDPMDRMITATAAEEGLALVTADERILKSTLPCRVIDARL